MHVNGRELGKLKYHEVCFHVLPKVIYSKHQYLHLLNSTKHKDFYIFLSSENCEVMLKSKEIGYLMNLTVREIKNKSKKCLYMSMYIKAYHNVCQLELNQHHLEVMKKKVSKSGLDLLAYFSRDF